MHMTDLDFRWQDRKACTKEDRDLFFSDSPVLIREAKKICQKCPVINECLEFCLANNEWGVWGGTDREQRRGILIRRGMAYARARRSNASQHNKPREQEHPENASPSYLFDISFLETHSPQASETSFVVEVSFL